MHLYIDLLMGIVSGTGKKNIQHAQRLLGGGGMSCAWERWHVPYSGRLSIPNHIGSVADRSILKVLFKIQTESSINLFAAVTSSGSRKLSAVMFTV